MIRRAVLIAVILAAAALAHAQSAPAIVGDPGVAAVIAALNARIGVYGVYATRVEFLDRPAFAARLPGQPSDGYCGVAEFTRTTILIVNEPRCLSGVAFIYLHEAGHLYCYATAGDPSEACADAFAERVGTGYSKEH